jgi:uncharacterized protein (TIGR00251 family)
MKQDIVGRDSIWFRHDAASRRCVLTLHVQPNARKSEIVGLHGGALKVRIAAPAAENRANAELVAFLAKALAVARSAIGIRHGATGRRKIVEVMGGADLAARLSALAARKAPITTRESRRST